MQLTIHAVKQAQHRGIKSQLAFLVEQYGDEFKGGGGCSLFRISSMEQRYLKNENPDIWRKLRDRQRLAVVVAGDNVITVMHRTKSLRVMKHFGDLH
jgi:hypothetical protein